MDMVVEFLAGLLILYIGSECLIRGAASLKRRLGAPDFVIGLVLVGFATSLPELVIAVAAKAQLNAQGLAVGTLVGSNIANVLLILGVVALILPLTVDRRALARDGLALLILSLLFVLFGQLRAFGGLEAAILLGAFVVYLIVVYVDERRLAQGGGGLFAAKAAFVSQMDFHPFVAAALVGLGAVGMVFGAGWLIEATAGYAIDSGISESVLGLTLVAVATSVPELVTSFTAARRGYHAVALGNVIGSNIFNLTVGAGIVAALPPGGFPADIGSFDVFVLAAAAVILMVALTTEKKLSRVEGAVLLALYAGYLVWHLT